jgi:hypothetical protein
VKLNRGRLTQLGIEQLASFGRYNATRLAAASGTNAARDYWLRQGMFSDPHEYDAFLRAFWDDVKAEVAGKECRAILASAEFLYNQCGTDREAIHSLIFNLAGVFETITVIFYCRDQVAWLKSVHAQRVKGLLKSTERYEDFLGNLGEYEALSDFHSTLGIWADEIGDENVRAGILDRRSLYGGNLIHDFLHKLGLGGQNADNFVWPEIKANVSPSFTILNLIRRSNVLYSRGVLPVRARNGIVRLLLSPRLASMGEGFPDELDRGIVQSYAQSNAHFNARFLSGLASGLPVK